MGSGQRRQQQADAQRQIKRFRSVPRHSTPLCSPLLLLPAPSISAIFRLILRDVPAVALASLSVCRDRSNLRDATWRREKRRHFPELNGQTEEQVRASASVLCQVAKIVPDVPDDLYHKVRGLVDWCCPRELCDGSDSNLIQLMIHESLLLKVLDSTLFF